MPCFHTATAVFYFSLVFLNFDGGFPSAQQFVCPLLQQRFVLPASAFSGSFHVIPIVCDLQINER